jgi:hypothetical protein
LTPKFDLRTALAVIVETRGARLIASDTPCATMTAYIGPYLCRVSRNASGNSSINLPTESAVPFDFVFTDRGRDNFGFPSLGRLNAAAEQTDGFDRMSAAQSTPSPFK